MALYEWQCPKCEAVTEQIVSYKDKEKLVVKCPRCHTTMKPVEHSKPAKFQWGRGGPFNG
jgi:putative FmdB family regulatory protein